MRKSRFSKIQFSSHKNKSKKKQKQNKLKSKIILLIKMSSQKKQKQMDAKDNLAEFVNVPHKNSEKLYNLGRKRGVTAEVWNYFHLIHFTKDDSQLSAEHKKCKKDQLVCCNCCGEVMKCVTGGKNKAGNLKTKISSTTSSMISHIQIRHFLDFTGMCVAYVFAFFPA